MIIPVDKEKVMAEFKAKYVDGRFEEEYIKIQEKFNKNKKSIKEEMICKFKEVCDKAKTMQEENLKNQIKYIYISYLRTNLMQDSGIYRVDLYDDKWFLDKEECSVNIDLGFIYEALFKHVRELQDRKNFYGRTITEMDVEKMKLKEGNKYHELGIKILESMLNDFIECNEYKEMKKSDEIVIFAGEYLDKAIMIYENSKEK